MHSTKSEKSNRVISTFNIIALLLNITIMLTIVAAPRNNLSTDTKNNLQEDKLTKVSASRDVENLSLVAAESPNTKIFKTLNLRDIANQSGSYVKLSRGTTSWIGTEENRNSSYLGLRFSDSAIAPKTKIVSASLEVTSSLTDWEHLNINIFAEKNSNPAMYEKNQKISDRNLISASQSVALDQKWYRGQVYSFNVTKLVQELIDNGMASNGLVNFVIQGTGKPYDYYFFYTDAERGPKLKIVFESSDTNISPTQMVLSPSPTGKSSPTPTKIPTNTPPTKISPTVPVSSDIWRPTTEKPIHWHWQLTQDFDFERDMPYLKDKTVFDIDGELTSAETVAKLHALGPDVKVICYFDAGVWEKYRSDAGAFPASVIGKADEGWAESKWLDTRQIDILRPIMEARIKNWCKDKGFDAIEPDETENQDENEGKNITGFNITRKETIAYNIMIAELAHKYGLSAGLKGNTTELAELVPYYEWTLNEECWQFKECKENMISFLNYRDDGYYKNFGKAVFNIEYKKNPDCTWSNANKMNSAKRDLNLQGPTHSAYSYQPCIADNIDTWP